MPEPQVAVLPLDSIQVAEGFNPRTTFDEGELDTLAASLKTTEGVVQALTVQVAADGSYVLIAGERRLRAARLAGIEKVPVLILGADQAKVATLVENIIRVDLNPVEVAKGLQALKEAEGVTTNKKIAEKVNKSPGFVSEHLRLLRLPVEVQRHIAAGHVPIAAERVLRKVAEVSPAVAEAVCGVVERGEMEGRDLIERFGQVLRVAANMERADRPAMIDACYGESLSRIVADPEAHAVLAERYRAVRPHEPGTDPLIRFSEAEVDAARAAGCLVEYQENRSEWLSQRVAYITDSDLAADLAEQVIERIEKQAATEAKSRAERAGADPGEGEAASPAEQIKEARRAEKAKRRLDAEEARRNNLAVGRALLDRRGAKSRKEHRLARARAIAMIVLEDNPTLAARGLRLAFEQLQEVEVKTLKSGEQREKVTYLDPAACQEYLRNRIEEARTGEEVDELLADALIAAELTDERELPQSHRVNGALRRYVEVDQMLKDDVEAVRPRRRRRKRS